MNGRIYVELYLAFLRTKKQALGLADSEKVLSCISIINLLKIMMSLMLVACMDSMGQLAESMKRSTIHCFTKKDSSGTCGFREEDRFYVCPIVSLWELMTARGRAIFDTNAAYEI